MPRISHHEYGRRYFNNIICESFATLHGRVIEAETLEPKEASANYTAAKLFIRDLLKLDSCTIKQTVDNIKSNTNNNLFVNKIVEKAEELAKEKTVALAKEEIEAPQDDEVAEEDKEIIEVIFDKQLPEDGIEAIRNATATALYNEDRKTNEVKEALKVVQDEEKDSTALEETINRLSQVRATSLFNSIMTYNTQKEVERSINENTNMQPRDVIINNRDKIIRTSVALYSLYETANAFGFKTFTSREIETIATEIYHS